MLFMLTVSGTATAPVPAISGARAGVEATRMFTLFSVSLEKMRTICVHGVRPAELPVAAPAR